jgi:dTDP-4-dehydrorhamnose reductase
MFAHANALCSKNNLNIAKELSEVVNWRQTIQSPKKKTKRQVMIQREHNRILDIEQHEPYLILEVNSGGQEE